MLNELGKRQRKKKELDDDFVNYDEGVEEEVEANTEPPTKVLKEDEKTSVLSHTVAPSVPRVTETNSTNLPSNDTKSSEKKTKSRRFVKHKEDSTSSVPSTNSVIVSSGTVSSTNLPFPVKEQPQILLPISINTAPIPISTASNQIDNTNLTEDNSSNRIRVIKQEPNGTVEPTELSDIYMGALGLCVAKENNNSDVAVVSTSTTLNNDDNKMLVTNQGDTDIRLQFKKSRDASYQDTFPVVLYTLTWKHKYDIRICSPNSTIFEDVDNLEELFQIELVIGEDLSTPIYDHSKVRQRTPTELKRKKRKHRKPNDTDTITITSVNKQSDNTVMIRFGINRTFCSKRFNYSPFRLMVKYNGEHSFQIYSSLFHTFAKKLNVDTVKNVNEILKKNNSSFLIPDEAGLDDDTPTTPKTTKKASTTTTTNEKPKQKRGRKKKEAAPSTSSNPGAEIEEASLLLALGLNK
ncbi:hypothetical protein ABK040_014375 [Willaertia magna]